MPVILATWEAEAGGSQVQVPLQQLSGTLSQNLKTKGEQGVKDVTQ